MSDIAAKLRKLQKVAALAKGTGPEAANAGQMLYKMVERLETSEASEINRMLDAANTVTLPEFTFNYRTHRPRVTHFQASGWHTPTGTVFHARRDCAALRKSKIVRHGQHVYRTKGQALEVACGRCGVFVMEVAA